MDGDEEWLLMRPVLRGLLPYSALNSTDYDLSDFVFCCEALDVEAENQLRHDQYVTKKREDARGKR